MKNKEYTYVMIKPDVSWNEVWVKKIKQIFQENGLEIVVTFESEANPMGYILLTDQQLEAHYGHVKKYGENVYQPLIKFMKSGFVIPLVLYGTNAVSVVRSLIGPTDSKQASKQTIRGLFGTNKCENAIHASDSVANAKIEIARFFKITSKEELDYIRRTELLTIENAKTKKFIKS